MAFLGYRYDRAGANAQPSIVIHEIELRLAEKEGI